MAETAELRAGHATWTCEATEYGNLYYVALGGRAEPPYKTQRAVMAVLDVAADGTLAGVELIEAMPPPPVPAPSPLPTEEPIAWRWRNRSDVEHGFESWRYGDSDPSRGEPGSAGWIGWDVRPMFEGPSSAPLPTEVGEVVERLRKGDKRKCPFPELDIAPEQPCPMCGDLGTLENSGKTAQCVAYSSAKLHEEAASLLTALAGGVDAERANLIEWVERIRSYHDKDDSGYTALNSVIDLIRRRTGNPAALAGEPDPAKWVRMDVLEGAFSDLAAERERAEKAEAALAGERDRT